MKLSSRKVADNFLRDQIRIMRKHGSAPKLTPAQYKKILAETQKSFESLRGTPSESRKSA